ncbi:Histone-lysine N-methyltransferase [Bertholletia excelsa]
MLRSNGDLCDKGLNKRHLENCFYNSSGVMLKYKKRKVSAVRDFPPGCGRNAPPINLVPQGNETIGLLGDKRTMVDNEKKLNVTEHDCVKKSEIVNETLSKFLMKSPSKLEMLEASDNLAGIDVTMAGKVSGVEISPIAEPPGSDLLKASENNAPESSENEATQLSKKLPELEDQAAKSEGTTDSKAILEVPFEAQGMVPADDRTSNSPNKCPTVNSNGVKEVVPKNRYRRRRVSATRDFPPFCGRNAPCPSEEERLCIVLGKARLEEAQGGKLREVMMEERSPVRETERPIIKALDAVVLDGHAKKSKFKGIVHKTETVYPEAAVQAVQLMDLGGADSKGSPLRKSAAAGFEDLDEALFEGGKQERKLDARGPELKTKSKEVVENESKDVDCIARGVGREIMVSSSIKHLKSKSPRDVALGNEVGMVIVQGLMAAANCPWRCGKGAFYPSPGVMNRSEVRRHDVSCSMDREKSKGKFEKKKFLPTEKTLCVSADTQIVNNDEDIAMLEKNANLGKGDVDPSLYSLVNKSEGRSHDSGSATYMEKSKRKSMKKKLLPTGKPLGGCGGAHIVKNKEDIAMMGQGEDSLESQRPREFEVTLPPFGPNSSSHGTAREKVRETLRLFQAICRKLLQGEESKNRQQGYMSRRIDLLAAQIIRDKGKEVNTGTKTIGSVPGVEVGDEFQYRVELALVGVHRLYQAGIDYIKQNGMIIATSIVASGGYPDDLDNPDVLIYSGQGGNAIGRDKQPEDQKLERGNLALKNSILAKNPVRVIRGSKETKASSSDGKPKMVLTYTYDGLYAVEKYWHDIGPHGKLVFKFELRRITGQPEVAWREVKKSKKCKIREGVCINDISEGKELFPICAVNTIDDEKPPKFNYITEMKYPDWYRPTSPEGCDCINGCTDSQKCACVVKNGGEIPYNYNGAIVEAKTLVYECGPSCKCPSSCYNRVTQHGINIQLEIFKTELRGWGVRALTSIASGSFICEYIGELLEDKEAEQRQNDEYLFDIGQNYNDCSLNGGLSSLNPGAHSRSTEDVDEGGFTIDAANYANVGRFINHSCSPNLYAQNVLYDHDDKRMPHIMLFAAENIPPLQELTYHYNYSVDQVRDSNGNIKMKNCYCGSTECIGRMY